MDYDQTNEDFFYPNGLLRTRKIFNDGRHVLNEDYFYHSNGNIKKIIKSNKNNIGHGEWKFFNEEGDDEVQFPWNRNS